jgi:hypothetical protein
MGTVGSSLYTSKCISRVFLPISATFSPIPLRTLCEFRSFRLNV